MLHYYQNNISSLINTLKTKGSNWIYKEWHRTKLVLCQKGLYKGVFLSSQFNIEPSVVHWEPDLGLTENIMIDLQSQYSSQTARWKYGSVERAPESHAGDASSTHNDVCYFIELFKIISRRISLRILWNVLHERYLTIDSFKLVPYWTKGSSPGVISQRTSYWFNVEGIVFTGNDQMWIFTLSL